MTTWQKKIDWTMVFASDTPYQYSFRILVSTIKYPEPRALYAAHLYLTKSHTNNFLLATTKRTPIMSMNSHRLHQMSNA